MLEPEAPAEEPFDALLTHPALEEMECTGTPLGTKGLEPFPEGGPRAGDLDVFLLGGRESLLGTEGWEGAEGTEAAPCSEYELALGTGLASEVAGETCRDFFSLGVGSRETERGKGIDSALGS